jgi:hypothetical protein
MAWQVLAWILFPENDNEQRHDYGTGDSARNTI